MKTNRKHREHSSPHPSFSIRRRLKSIRYAWSGLIRLFRDEHNARIHLAATMCVIVCGILLHISTAEWIAVTLCIGIVVAFEAINTAIERLCDVVSPDRSDAIKKIKDVSAAAVFVAAISAAITGMIVFIPKVIALF